MRRFLHRLLPSRLAGQISLLILAAILLFHLALTTARYVGLWNEPVFTDERQGAVAAALLALDAAAPSERVGVQESLRAATPWMTFSLRDDPPPDAHRRPPSAHLAAQLWPGAEVYADGAASEPAAPRELIVKLRKGGYVVAKRAEPRVAAAAESTFLPRIVERSALFFLLSVALVTTWITTAVVAPLARLAREAERFPHEHEKIGVDAESGPREVRDLARALNRMQDRIQSMIAARTHTLAAISHDLRTIITRVRLRSEFIADNDLRTKMLRDAELMDSMLRKNLEHLRDARGAAERVPIDLDSVLQTVTDQFADLGHDVSYQGRGRQLILGSLTEMQRVFANLIENAVNYGHKVDIALDQPSAREIQVDVADDGPGISDENKMRLLEPFERGESARNLDEHGGFGLGLSIVRTLVNEAGGRLQLLDRDPRGLIARVTLPCCTPAE